MSSFDDIVVAFLVAGIANLVILKTIRRRLPGDEGVFLTRVYGWTLFLRLALACFLNVYSTQTNFATMFWGDSGTYDFGGWLLSQKWDGQIVGSPFIREKVSGWGFYYFVGALYWAFGRNQLLVQFVNATIGAVTMVVIYAIAKDLFDIQTAQWAARFMSFFPQIVFWSGAMYKDPAVMLCIAACMYSVLRLSAVITVRHILLFVCAALALMTLRFYVFYFVAFATLSTFVLSQRRGLVGSVASYLVVVAVFLAAFSYAASRETLEQQQEFFTWERLQITRTDEAARSESAIVTEANVSTPEGALSALPMGLVYLLFAPFPWAVRGIRQILTVPETLVWYALWPALIRGLLQTLRHRFRYALPILVFSASLTAAYAVVQGNIGTAYRQRTQVTMFYFIFMAAGLVEKRRAHARDKATVPQPAFQLR
jgi:4-amino-4-deoxy-L-arabinose transferase-like glycosyltransferase